MIISASYKTDIPTFYGEWFMHRLEAGYCKMVNPYNQRIYRIDLAPEHVDGFVFWTKNIGPFLRNLYEVRKRGYPFIVQHTINGYPRQLEFRVIDYFNAVENMKRLSGEYGPNIAIWRYDPIIVSSLTSLDWHRHNFAQLAKALEGTTDEVVVSFAQIYKKTKRNMDWAAKELQFQWDEHETVTDESKRSLMTDLALIAQSHGMHLKVCSQKALLVPDIVQEARCVDADRFERISHKSIQGKRKQKGNRKECECFASKDIGEYDTCPHGCVYCYAVQNRDQALQRYKAHDPKSEFLFPPRGFTSSLEDINLLHVIPVENIHRKEAMSEIIQEKLFE